jgi:hypothetical protein
MDGFEAIARIGKSSADDDAHGVVHIGLLHLIFDVDGDSFLPDVHKKPLNFGANFTSKLKIKSPLCQPNEVHTDRWRNEFQIENVVRMC